MKLKDMKTKVSKYVYSAYSGLLLTLLVTSPVSAAVVNFSAEAYADGQVSTNGTLIGALNATSAETVNTVDFAALGANQGIITLTGGVQVTVFGGSDTSTGSNGTAGALTNSGIFSTVNNGNIHFAGLSIGQEYEVQFIFSDDRTVLSPDLVNLWDNADGSGTASFTTADILNNAQIVTGTFTADATTQDFYMDQQTDVGTFDGYVAAFQLRATQAILPPAVTFSAADYADGQISTRGTLVGALNATSAETVNTVDFTALGANQGIITLTGGVQVTVFGGSDTSTGSNGTAGELTNSGIFSTVNNGNIHFAGLTAGQSYEVQFIFSDDRANLSPNFINLWDNADGSGTADFTTVNILNDAQIVTAIFTADATTQDFYMDQQTAVGTFDGYVAAFQLRAVEETTPAIGLEAVQTGTELSWTVEEEIGVKEYQVVDAATGEVLEVIVANESGSYGTTVAEGVEAKLVVVDKSGYTQTYVPADGNNISVVYDLNEGWNLIALPGDNADTTALQAVTAGEIWAWNGTTYETTEAPASCQGIWVYAPNTVQTIVTAEKSDAEITLQTGWNLVGPKENIEVPETAHTIYGWNETYQNIATEDGVLIQGIGYWIFSL